MAWLVTGGAGYIGSHVSRAFLAANIECVVLDDLSSGHRDFVDPEARFYEGSILDRELLDRICTEEDIVGVVHLAGFKYAGVSVARPVHTYTQNVTGMMTLLDALAVAGVINFVFSSSAAVYGTPETDVVTEQSPTRPESPYGESKLIGEWLLRDQAQAVELRHTSAVLQCGRVWLRRPEGHQPAQPFPAGIRAAGQRRGALHQWRELPHQGWHVRSGLRTCVRSCSVACRRGSSSG